MLWFYYSPNGKHGPFSVEELKRLAATGVLKKKMVVENQRGEQALAETVNGLVFPELQSAADRNWSIPQSPPIFERNEFLTLDGEDADASMNVNANVTPDLNPDATQDANAPSGKGDFLKKIFQEHRIRRWNALFQGLKLMFVISKNDVNIDESVVWKSVNFLKISFSFFLISYCLTVIGLFFWFLRTIYFLHGLEIVGLIPSVAVALFLAFSGVGGYFFLRGIFCLLIELGIKLPFQILKEIERILKGVEDASSCAPNAAHGRVAAEFQKNGPTNPTNQSSFEIPNPPPIR